MSSLERYVRRLRAVEKLARAAATQPQLAHASIEDGAILSMKDGTLRAIIGEQFDGSHGTVVVNGAPPPAPTTPTLTAAHGGLVVKWDGLFAASAIVPLDFSRVEVHISPSSSLSGLLASTLVDTIETPRGGQVYMSLPPGTYYARLVCRNLSGQTSSASAVASVDVADPDFELPERLSEESLQEVYDEFAPVSGSPNYAPRTSGIASLPTPWYLAHRGLSMAMPENTEEGFDVALEGGADGLEADVQALADGGVILMHDFSVDRTTDGTGLVSSLTSLDIAKLNASDGHPWPQATKVPFLSRFINKYGGKTALVIEPKDLASVSRVAAQITKLGLEDSTIVYSSDNTVLAAIVAAGLTAGWYKSTSPTGAEVDAAIAAGADWLLGNLGWNTDADITLMVGKGKPVMVFAVERRADRDRMISLGVTSLGTNEVVYVKRDAAIRTTDSWRNGLRGHGLTPGASATPLQFVGGALRLVTTGLEFCLVGEVSPIANAASTYNIDLDLSFNTLPSDLTRWLSVPYAQATDALYLSQANLYKSGYEPLLRANGQMQLWRMTAPNTPLLLGVTSATPALTAGAFAHLKITTTPTTITMVRTDTPVATLSAGLTAGVAVTSLPINTGLPAQSSGAKVQLPTGQIATLTAAAAANATSLTVASITPSSAVASGASLFGAIQVTDFTFRGGYLFVGKTGTGTADFKNLSIT